MSIEPTFSLFDFAQRTAKRRKVFCAQGLCSCIVSAIKRRLSVPAARRFSVSRPIEPEPQVVHLYWIGGRVGGCIWKRPAWESVWRGGCTRRDYKCLNAEAPYEVSYAPSVAIGLDISLIPTHAEGFIGSLNYKKVKVDIGGRGRHLDVQVLHGPKRVDGNASGGVGKASSGCSGSGSYHVEDEVILSDCRGRQRDQQCPQGRHQGTKSKFHLNILLISVRRRLGPAAACVLPQETRMINAPATLPRYPGNPLISHLLSIKCRRRTPCAVVLNFRTM